MCKYNYLIYYKFVKTFCFICIQTKWRYQFQWLLLSCAFKKWIIYILEMNYLHFRIPLKWNILLFSNFFIFNVLKMVFKRCCLLFVWKYITLYQDIDLIIIITNYCMYFSYHFLIWMQIYVQNAQIVRWAL